MEPSVPLVCPSRIRSPGGRMDSFASRNREKLDRQLRDGRWTTVVARVDEVLLRAVMHLTADETATIHDAAQSLRARRLSRGSSKSIDDVTLTDHRRASRCARS